MKKIRLHGRDVRAEWITFTKAKYGEYVVKTSGGLTFVGLVGLDKSGHKGIFNVEKFWWWDGVGNTTSFPGYELYKTEKRGPRMQSEWVDDMCRLV